MRTRLLGAVALAVLLLSGGLPTVLAPSAAVAAPAGNLVSNGSFEDPALSPGAQAAFPDVELGPLPGWFRAAEACRVQVERGGTDKAADGEQYVVLDSCETSRGPHFDQHVDVLEGATYRLSWAYAGRKDTPERLQVRVDSQSVADVTATGSSGTAPAWETFTRTVTARSSRMLLSFGVLGFDTASPAPGGLLDDVSLVQIAPPPPYRQSEVVAQNTSWTNAAALPEATSTAGTLGGAGEARWYRFPVVPGSQVQVDATGLTADADLTLFGDIGAAFTTLTSAKEDLPRLGAEFAGEVFSPSVYSPSVYSPSVYSPSVYSPSVYSPSVYSPSVYSPSVYSPSVYSPSVYSPSVYSPSVYSPSVYSPSVYSPSVYSPSVYSPSVYSPSVYSPSVYSPEVDSPSQAFLDAFSGAQTRSLLTVSARDGTAAESVRASTWSSTGSFYVRVQSRDTAAGTPFSVRLTTSGGPCAGVPLSTATDVPLPDTPGSPTTVVLTDTARLGLSDKAKTTYLKTLGELAAGTDGVVVDAADVTRTKTLNAQADAHPACWYAKNLVAQSLRDVVNGYRTADLQHVVIAGTDGVVPFFRYADDAGLGPESDFVPPVRDDTAAQASLRSNQVLGQDAYGTVDDIMVKGAVLPVPDLAVGRLVETPAEIEAQVQRFLANEGVLPEPTSSLVTGYDFLTRAADSVQADLEAGLGSTGQADTLVTDQGVPTTTTTVGGTPDRRHSWTASDLREALLGERHDLVFLAGHFSASEALAADYETSLSTADIAAHPGTFTDSLVFSAGCHSGYSLTDTDGIPGLTQGLDWTQAMAQQGATLIAGTGYQYADTDFLAYSAKLYAQFAEQLRAGTAGTPVQIGQALVQAKQDYLAGVGTLAGIDRKSLLQATLYGLPMTGLDLPAGRTGTDGAGGGTSPSPVAAGTPGAELGLQTAQFSSSPSTTVQQRAVVDVNGAPTGATYRWLTGPDGVQTQPALPALPLDTRDVTSNDGSVLRGVGFRSGTYTDTRGTTPLTGAPGTEHNGIHTSFESPTFFPHRLATPNWFGALTSSGDGRTRLQVTPAQHRADPGALTATERRYSSVGLELFYSSNIENYDGNVPALAAPPSLSQVTGVVTGSQLAVSARVTGDPSAGIQSAWVTYTAESGPLHEEWASVDLVQSGSDSTLWEGTVDLPAGQAAGAVRFVVQAANGVGLVALDDALGSYYTPSTSSVTPPAPTSTTTTFASSPPSTGRYGATLSVPVKVSGAPKGSVVSVFLGTARATGTTAPNGVADVRLPLRVQPGTYALTASYAGSSTVEPSSVTRTGFVVSKALSTLVPSVLTATVPVTGDASRWFTLTSAGVPLAGKAVLIDVYDRKVRRVTRVTRQTDLRGRVDLGGLTLVPGTLGVVATFGVAGAGSTADPTYAPAVSGMALTVP